MRRRLKGEAGFTLIEILIVIIVLGILAMVIVPQITVSTSDAKLSTLQTDLSAIRSTIETYYAQHGNTYPGQTSSAAGTEVTTAADAQTSMVAQLNKYTNDSGQVSSVKNSTFPYGPYIKGPSLPANPFSLTKGVVCSETASIDAARAAVSTGTAGWKYHFKTGVFYANDADRLDY